MSSKWSTALATLLILVATNVSGNAAPAPQKYLETFPNFNNSLAPQLPGDVDVNLKKTLDSQKKFAEVQRLFDLWAWQSFVTLNWPTNDQGQFAPSLGDTAFGPPKWTNWHESPTIFRDDGGVPASCNPNPTARALSLTREATLPVVHGLAPFQLPTGFEKRKLRLLGNISAVGELSTVGNAGSKSGEQASLDDIKQAFTAPLIDQNGNFVFYEIMIDPNEVGYICSNKLYNVNGQVSFTHGDPNAKATLPSGSDSQDGSGSWELKFAWRVLTKADDKSRFLWTNAIVSSVNGTCPDKSTQKKQCDVEVGLVGMHIGHKSVSAPQWIWATFEQVDNLSIDNVVHPGLKPSFFDPGCPICMPNQPPAQQGDGWVASPPTQAWRAIPIPADKVALNAQGESGVEKAHSALAYYQLIDTQWPTDPTAPPSKPEAGLPGSVENKSGGNPTPVFLTNITMETYFQQGAQPACQQEEGQSCATAPWLTANQKQAHAANLTSIFATESCTGCHSSAGLFITPKKTSGQLMADFSWLFSQKAHLAKSPP